MEDCKYGYCKSIWNQFKKYAQQWVYPKRLQTSVVCTAPTLVRLNVIDAAFHENIRRIADALSETINCFGGINLCLHIPLTTSYRLAIAQMRQALISCFLNETAGTGRDNNASISV